MPSIPSSPSCQWVQGLHCSPNAITAYHKTAVTPALTHWSYNSLALYYPYQLLQVASGWPWVLCAGSRSQVFINPFLQGSPGTHLTGCQCAIDCGRTGQHTPSLPSSLGWTASDLASHGVPNKKPATLRKIFSHGFLLKKCFIIWIWL